MANTVRHMQQPCAHNIRKHAYTFKYDNFSSRDMRNKADILTNVPHHNIRAEADHRKLSLYIEYQKYKIAREKQNASTISPPVFSVEVSAPDAMAFNRQPVVV